jgi:hypothetical protein
MAGHQPVEQHAERGQVLLDRGRREQFGPWRKEPGLQILDERGDVDRLDGCELADAVGLAPGCEAARGIQVCVARVIVLDLGEEEFEDPLGGLGRRCEERRRNTGRRGEGTRAVEGAMSDPVSSVIKDVELSRSAAM